MAAPLQGQVLPLWLLFLAPPPGHLHGRVASQVKGQNPEPRAQLGSQHPILPVPTCKTSLLSTGSWTLDSLPENPSLLSGASRNPPV